MPFLLPVMDQDWVCRAGGGTLRQNPPRKGAPPQPQPPAGLCSPSLPPPWAAPHLQGQDGPGPQASSKFSPTWGPQPYHLSATPWAGRGPGLTPGTSPAAHPSPWLSQELRRRRGACYAPEALPTLGPVWVAPSSSSSAWQLSAALRPGPHRGSCTQAQRVHFGQVPWHPQTGTGKSHPLPSQQPPPTKPRKKTWANTQPGVQGGWVGEGALRRAPPGTCQASLLGRGSLLLRPGLSSMMPHAAPRPDETGDSRTKHCVPSLN